MIDRVAGPPAQNFAFASTATRPTPTPARPSVAFSAVLAATNNGLTQGANAALKVLPGSPQLAGAIRGGTPMNTMSYGATSGTLGGGGGSSPIGPTMGGGGVSMSGGVGLGTGAGGMTVGAGGVPGTTGDPVTDMATQEQALLNEQIAIQSETETFTTLSNSLNAMHSAKEAAIQNLRC